MSGIARPSGFYVHFSQALDLAQNRRLHALHRALLADLPPGVSDVCPGYVNLYVEFDEVLIAPQSVRAWVRGHLNALETVPETGQAGRTVTLPVRYDGEDLPDVAARCGLSVPEVIGLHAGRDYDVYAVGFTPGFPFLGELDERLRLPRRASPRAAVPGGAVAVAAAQTCVYPLPSPGGWNLIGTALEAVYDPNRADPFLIAPGDRVRFVAAQGTAPPLPAVRELWPPEPRLPALRVEEPGLLDLMMDGGRPRQGHFGMARSGPLDGRSARVANALVGNPPGMPLLELTLRGPVLIALRDVVAAVAGFGMVPDGPPMGESFLWRAGETLRLRSTLTGARAYLALSGGLETLPFLGSSSVDLLGRVGRPLRAGDVLGLAQQGRARPGFSSPLLELPSTTVLRLLPGPQATPQALAALGNGTFRLASLDRMGLRLSGAAVPGGQLTSEATPLGAVQVPPGGDPILLLHDRGRLGGYSKPAVLHPHDLPLAAQLRPGQHVRFRPDVSGTPQEWRRGWQLE